MDVVSYILAKQYTNEKIAEVDPGASGEQALQEIAEAKQDALSGISTETESSVQEIKDAAQQEATSQIANIQSAAQSAAQEAANDIATEKQNAITDLQEEAKKQNSSLAGTTAQALEVINLAANNKVAQINEVNSHSPIINEETGKWQLWDEDSKSYVDTDIDAEGQPGEPGQPGQDGEKGDPGTPAGFGTPTATATTLPYGEEATVTVTSDGPDTAKVFNFEFGIPQGAPGSGGGGGGTVSVTVGETTTGEPGTEASVVNSGDDQNVVLEFTIPRGEAGQDGAAGADGQDGAPGQAATITVGSVSTGEPGTNASVTNSGTENAAVFDFVIPRGADGTPGQNGEDGADGQAATITVGNVTTGDPGTDVIINNSGTENAAILDFTIPRGAPGADGQDGQPGAAAGFGEPTATVDDTSGTPSVKVTSSGPDTAKIFNFQFSGLKGADGANGADGQRGEPGQDGTPAGFGTPSATIDNTSGEPSVTVDATGPDTAKIFTFHFSGLKGQDGTDGADGAPGEDGAAATIQVGTVTTLEPGEQATVENVGTENAAILNFGIPKGEQGEPGTGGGGQGVPAGGTTGQILAKASDSDYDTRWVDAEGGTTPPVSIYSGQATGEQTDIEVLNQIAPSPRHGDIGIVTHDIYDEIDSSNAYVYNTTGDANVWQPLNSKYNAEDVYFASNLVITANIGVQTIDSSGSKTLDTAGKNLKQVLDMIVAEEKNPSVTQPSVSVTLSNSGAKEVGTNFTPNYSCGLNPGSYQYGPATGVTATSWSISDTNSNSSDTQNGSLTAFQVIEGTNYRVSATVQYTAGAIPVTNLGNEYASGQIQAGSKSANSATVTGYRNTFYGTLTTKDSLPDSTVIRGLSRSNRQLNNGSKFSINIPVGAIRVVISYPATLRNLTSVTDVNGMGAEIGSSFTLNTIQVSGENNYNPVDYKTYILDYANPNDTQNTYNVTI